MDIETVIKLNSFKPREYQREVVNAIEKDGFKKVLLIFHRRAGKDVVSFNIMIRQALQKVGLYLYCLPTYNQGRKVLWDGILSSGARFLSFIPSELISNKNNQEMKLTLINGSIIQVVGSENTSETLVGTNPQGIVFSEWAISNPDAYTFLRPALVYNNGWCIFQSTPRGRSFFYEMYEIARNSPKEWFVSVKTINDTGVISAEEIAKEKAEGLISDDMIEQEYYCSFNAGTEGSFYFRYVNKMLLEGRIGTVPFEPSFPVHTAWDLGYRDLTVIIFYQCIGAIVRIIRVYSNNFQGMEHYANILYSYADKYGYQYGKHWAPHDIAVHDYGTGQSRIEKAKNLGIKFQVHRDKVNNMVSSLPKLSVEDGIEAVRSAFPKLWIDENNCSQLIKALELYRREWDPKRKVYKEEPLHDIHSHYCFVGETLIKTPNKDIPIKDIKVGDYVLTPLGKRKVLAVHKRLTHELCNIETSTSHITCTPEHKIFTQRGLVSADTLRYTDILEKYSKVRNWIWQKIFSYLFMEQGIVGFKKTILSQKMKSKLSLMDSIISGMGSTIRVEKANQIIYPHYKEQSGLTIMETSPKDALSITKMEINQTIISKILNVLQKVNIFHYMLCDQNPGHNLKHVKTNSEALMLKQQSGIEAKQVENGIENTQINHCLFSKEQCIQKNVTYAEKISSGNKHGRNTVLMRVKQKIAYGISWISWIGIVVYAKLCSIVINMLFKKHVVKNVKSFQCNTPKEVYDLTIETDNCYYANDYLVSNCDCLRYLILSLPKTKDGHSAEELDRRYREAVFGENFDTPVPFRDIK